VRWQRRHQAALLGCTEHADAVSKLHEMLDFFKHPNCCWRIHPPAPVSPELAAWHGAHCLFALCSQLGVFSKTNEQPLQNMPGDQVMEEFHHNVSKPWIERLARVDADTQKALDLDAQVRFA
jgi:hypothetical protein